MTVGFNAARNGASPLNVSKILDGVVHFEVRAFDTNGFSINPTNSDLVAESVRTNSFLSPIVSGLVDYSFPSNQIPAFVELELGVLEQQTYERYRQIPVATAQYDYLQKQAGHVQLFRQRVTLRNVDRTAYQ